MSSPEVNEPPADTVEAVADDGAAKQSPTVDFPEKKRLSIEPLTAFSDESYACDRQYAIVLAQLMSVKERDKVYTWIDRIDTMKDSDDMREERDLYLKFLTVSLNNGKLVPPFTKDPPAGLRPLSTIVPRSVYNFIFKGKYNNGDCNQRPSKEIVHKLSPPDEVEPSQFFARQPVPHNGGLVYAAAFSTKK
ncbi:uncharacterized protein LOC113558626 [Rhopalosiphum maidis]|uniref:uncharacterized protein LOC113558626 n=1 Tax=Rhopalosiphum maidis TaxID=43146 RepID=UPI000EFF34BD|nr:uncharacterized protein LOC113558626 [Rhopalosiphum maidis]XP_026819922.1 uncharacterized protein LOC113558626 [Rhopalosiphum maidis]